MMRRPNVRTELGRGHRRIVFSVMTTLMVLGAGLFALAASASAKGNGDGVASASLSNTTISSAGPLNNIYLSNQLNCQVDHVGDDLHEFFDPEEVPGACGTLIAIGGTLYGPSELPAGGDAEPRTTYTEVSQTPVTGSGTSGD